MDWEYKILRGDVYQVEEDLNAFAREGWEPAFYQVAGPASADNHMVLRRRVGETLEQVMEEAAVHLGERE